MISPVTSLAAAAASPARPRAFAAPGAVAMCGRSGALIGQPHALAGAEQQECEQRQQAPATEDHCRPIFVHPIHRFTISTADWRRCKLDQISEQAAEQISRSGRQRSLRRPAAAIGRGAPGHAGHARNFAHDPDQFAPLEIVRRAGQQHPPGHRPALHPRLNFGHLVMSKGGARDPLGRCRPGGRRRRAARARRSRRAQASPPRRSPSRVHRSAAGERQAISPATSTDDQRHAQTPARNNSTARSCSAPLQFAPADVAAVEAVGEIDPVDCRDKRAPGLGRASRRAR